MEYLPASVNTWVGFCSLLLEPSPKSHVQEVTLPVERSTKSTSKGNTPEVLLGENAAFKGAVDVKPGEVNWPRPNVPADISPLLFIASMSTRVLASPSLDGFQTTEELVISSDTQTPTSVAMATWLKLSLLYKPHLTGISGKSPSTFTHPFAPPPDIVSKIESIP